MKREFSDKYGYTSPSPLKFDSVSDSLRTKLWNEVLLSFDSLEPNEMREVFHRVMGLPLDIFNHGKTIYIPFIKNWFFSLEWLMFTISFKHLWKN
jgi:hypothetical protein